MLAGETLVERHLRQLATIGSTRVVVVCNKTNYSHIARRVERMAGSLVSVVLQRGPDMTSAVREGLAHIGFLDSVFVVCVNDIVKDEAYSRIAAARSDNCNLYIPTIRLQNPFIGGRLILCGDARCVLRIDEKPLGGCSLGDYANIMIHRYDADGPKILANALEDGSDYESSVSKAIGRGTLNAEVVHLDSWTPIKTRTDLSVAEQLCHLDHKT